MSVNISCRVRVIDNTKSIPPPLSGQTSNLISALKEKRIAGAGLDVFSREPLPPESELWGLENVIMTPHISGGTPRYMERVVGLFCDNLRRYVAREQLVNVVDPERGY